MFDPINKPVSREPFDSRVGMTLDSGQGIQSSRLVLLGTPVLGERPDLNWQPVTWFKEYAFRPVPDILAPTSDWSFTSDHLPTFPFHVGRVDQRLRNFTLANPQPWFGGSDAWRDAYQPTARMAECNAKDPPLLLTPEQPPSYYDGSTEDRPGLELEASFVDTSGSTNEDHQPVGYWETAYVYNDGSHPNPWWFNEVNNAQGYTVEIRCVPVAGWGHVIMDDGVRRLNLLVGYNGILVHHTSDGNTLGTRCIWFPMENLYAERAIRIGVLGDDFYIMDESGLSFVGAGLNTDNSVAKSLIIGHQSTSEGPGGVLLLNSVKAVFDGVYLDIEDDISYARDTSSHTSYTGGLRHTRHVASFDTAIIKSVSPYAGGSTKIQPQYRNTSNPSWTNLGTPTTLSQETQEISLSGIPVDSDGSDEVRFGVIHQSGAPTTKPAPVDEIAVNTTFVPPEVSLDPEFGIPDGGGVVRILSSGPALSTSDQVWVDGVQVNPANINFISTSELHVTWPAGSRGTTVPVEVRTPTGYMTDRGYRYVSAYDRGVDRYELMATAHGARSPFQIKDEVPDGEVNLAYLAGRGVEPLANSSLVDLSYLESSNIAGGSLEPTYYGGANTSDVGDSRTYAYASGPSTEEVEVAGGAAGWRELGVPAPLFYKHLLGGGRFYLRSEQDPLNIENLRDSILVHTKDGRAVKLEDYPWDILVSTKDVDGNNLPAKTYSVIILTGRKFLPGKTVFATATFADRSNKWQIAQGRSEVINPVPIVLRGADRQGFDTFPDVDGNLSLEIRT